MKITHEDDYNLVHSYLLGDEKAGEQLYLKAIPLLRRFVYKKTCQSALPSEKKEEIIADVLKNTIEKLTTFNGTSSFATFVIGYARNHIMRGFNTATKETKIVPLGNLTDLDENIDASFLTDLQLYGKNPLQIIIEKEETEALMKVLGGLSPEYQQVIQMRLFNRTSVKKIATITGKSEDAIESLFRRAIGKFRTDYMKIYESATEKDQ